MPEFSAEDSVTFGERKPKKGRKRFFRQGGRRAPASEAHTICGGDNEKSGTSRRGVANATTSLRPKRGKRDVRASQPTYFQCKLTYKVLKTVVFEAFNVNNQCISADSSVLAWKKKREWLTSHCVFHSIRFKVNKVGIQWYPIFFAPWPQSMTVSLFSRLDAEQITPAHDNLFVRGELAPERFLVFGRCPPCAR